MTRRKVLRVPVSRTEEQRIREQASLRGYASIAAFLRDSAIKNMRFIDEKLLSIEQKIDGIINIKKKKINRKRERAVKTISQ